MSINLKPFFPVACFLASLFFIVSCEKTEEPNPEPEPEPGMTASFTITNNNCTAVCQVLFTNTSENAATYSWDFGDGSPVSTEINPKHIYPKSGTYQITLTAFKAVTFAVQRQIQTVQINRPASPYAIGTSKNEFGTGLMQTGDGGYVVAGSRDAEDGSTDVYLFKTDASRNVIWEKRFGGSGNQVGNAIKPTSDGGYIIVGKTTTLAWGYDYDDVYLVRTDAEGNLIWEKTFSNATNEAGEDVIQTGDGGFLITGISKAEGPATDLLLIKTDVQGNTLWEKRLGTLTGEDAGYTIQQASDGNFIVGGYYNNGPGGVQPYMIKIDNEGTIIWEQHTAGELVYIFSVRETSDGGLIWAGVNGAGSSHWRGVITKTDENGVVEWSNKFPQPGYLLNQIECVRQTSDGGYIMCGLMDESGYDYPVRRQILVIKTDATGMATWTKTYAAGGRLGNAFDIQQTPEGGYILVGHMLIEPVYSSVYYPIPNDFDVYLLKIDQNGTPQ